MGQNDNGTKRQWDNGKTKRQKDKKTKRQKDKKTKGQKDKKTKRQKDKKTTMRYCGSGVISHGICNHEILWFCSNISRNLQP